MNSAFYNSTAWRRLSRAFLCSKNYICERCGSLAEIAHHKTYLTAENVGDASISMNAELLEALCKNCHNTEHFGTGGAVLAGIALYMLTADKELGAEVYSVTTKYAQARLLFDEAHNIVKLCPDLSKLCHKRKNDLYYKPTMSKMQPLSRNSDNLDCLNASFVIMDELHAIRDRNLYEVMRRCGWMGLRGTGGDVGVYCKLKA